MRVGVIGAIVVALALMSNEAANADTIEDFAVSGTGSFYVGDVYCGMGPYGYCNGFSSEAIGGSLEYDATTALILSGEISWPPSTSFISSPTGPNEVPYWSFDFVDDTAYVEVPAPPGSYELTGGAPGYAYSGTATLTLTATTPLPGTTPLLVGGFGMLVLFGLTRKPNAKPRLPCV